MPRAAILVLALALVTGARTAPAQPLPAGAVGVDGIVARALSDNPELRALRADIDAARGPLRQAGLRPNPMLDLGGRRTWRARTTTCHRPHRAARSERAQGGARRRRRARGGDRAGSGGRPRAPARRRCANEGGRAARRTPQPRHHDDLLEANRRVHGLVRERASRGAAPPLEESLLLVEVNRLDAGLAILESRVEVLVLQLKALAGMPPDDPLVLTSDLGGFPRLPRARGGTRARPRRSGRPRDGARGGGDGARAGIRKEEAEGRWDASVNVGYQRRDFGFALNGG